MRARLFYNPAAVIERLALALRRQSRRRPLRGTPAARLGLGHLDSLELLQLLAPAPPQVIHDIGANVGTWTCLAKSLYPSAFVEAFEPLECHHGGFLKWTSSWKDVRLHPLALGSREGMAMMEVANFSDASSVLPLTEDGRTTFGLAPAGRREMRVAVLDHLVASGEVRAPDLIKIDVQGYELEVLRGAEKCLSKTRAVICEVSFRRFYAGQALFRDLLVHLEDRGFVLHAFGSSLGLGERLVQADALFLKP